jgi:hypothetical protein
MAVCAHCSHHIWTRQRNLFCHVIVGSETVCFNSLRSKSFHSFIPLLLCHSYLDGILLIHLNVFFYLYILQLSINAFALLVFSFVLAPLLFQCECGYFLSWFCCTHVLFSYIPLYLPIVTFPLALSFTLFFPPVLRILHFCSYPVLPVLTVSLVFIIRHVPRTCPMSYVVCPCPGHVDSGPRIEWNLESSFVFFLHLTRLPGGVLSQAVSFLRLPRYVFHWRSLNVCLTICLSLYFYFYFHRYPLYWSLQQIFIR